MVVIFNASLRGGASGPHRSTRRLLQFWEAADAPAHLKAPIVLLKTSRGTQSSPLSDDGHQGDANVGDGRWAHWLLIPDENKVELSLYDQTVSGTPLYQSVIPLPTGQKIELGLERLANGYTVETKTQEIMSTVGDESPGQLGSAGNQVEESPVLPWLVAGGTTLAVVGSLVAVARRQSQRRPIPRPVGIAPEQSIWGLPGFPKSTTIWVMPPDAVQPILTEILPQILLPMLIFVRPANRTFLAGLSLYRAWELDRPDPKYALEMAEQRSAVIVAEGPYALSTPFRGESSGAVVEELLRLSPVPVLMVLRPDEEVPKGFRVLRFEPVEGGWMVGDKRISLRETERKVLLSTDVA